MDDYEPMMSFDRDICRDLRRRPPRRRGRRRSRSLPALAGAGPALELAIGTGRIALPLAARGVRVDGIDLSPAMVARLREKPGGDRHRGHHGRLRRCRRRRAATG